CATPPSHIHPLSLHDALPIFRSGSGRPEDAFDHGHVPAPARRLLPQRSAPAPRQPVVLRTPVLLRDPPFAVDPASLLQPLERRGSEEHTSELQSREYLVCRLL